MTSESTLKCLMAIIKPGENHIVDRQWSRQHRTLYVVALVVGHSNHNSEKSNDKIFGDSKNP